MLNFIIVYKFNKFIGKENDEDFCIFKNNMQLRL